jgi:Fe-S-cluster containining protein
MSGVIRFPTDERFSCQGCAKCCRAFSIPVSPEQAARLRGVKHRHGARDPIREVGGRFLLERVDGACGFLEADGRCAVHAQLGPEAKPDPCRSFPFTAAEDAAGTWYARASFTCPTIVKGEGASGEELAASVRRDVSPVRLPATVRLGRHALAPEVYDRLEATISTLIEHGPDLPRALATAGALAWKLARGADPAADMEALTSPPALEELAREARPFDRARDARMLLAPFLLMSAPPEQTRVSRALHAVRLLLGAGRFRNAACAGDVPLAEHARVRWSADLEAPGGLLRRYVLHLFRSRMFLVDHPVEMALTLLAAAYALVRWSARGNATLAGRDRATLDDVALAVPATDLTHFAHNVTEHWLLSGSAVGTWVSLMLAGPRRIAGLVLES